MGNVQNIGVDASKPELIVSLKKLIDERHQWQYIQDKVLDCKKEEYRYSRMYDSMSYSFQY